MDEDLPLIGFGLPVSGAWATPAAMVHVARRAEELGYASLWTFQRVLSPVAEESGDEASARPPSDRPADHPSYLAVHDAVLPLAYIAGHTSRIGLGTATLCAPFTAPALLAKAMASLDQLSGGRLTVGLGMGWMRAEYAAAGIPFERRGARMEEYLRALVALWTEDPVRFDGEFYTVPLSRTGPAPVQSPHPPVLVGAAAPAALRRAGRLAQGWIGSADTDPVRAADSIALVREGAREAGRRPDELRFVVRVVPDLTASDPGRRTAYRGTAEQLHDDLVRLRRSGVTEVILDLNFSPHVVSPGVTPDEATSYADEVLLALAHR
ncbi:TIGR03619 family F420-dependent LLM class oxidoreductase [Allobranchiibius sp. CTAmp26]|uniref:TIGR03619 family F420-dependent LLM class oxidoreductase n=1 Tax=Allobranchiibius sp. CTAmp26 TaxID=2815214 RepID=UPI001AA19604|nr:TIGR03619 family F420-dependent LLM class oxidoreductase [Allobranchiibius sp. CTAmp26]MBO1755722.1 TIGR03619 family F420-dependent LLM class oxidoreductase [Allobranchiibius sp. CTAmp26]